MVEKSSYFFKYKNIKFGDKLASGTGAKRITLSQIVLQLQSKKEKKQIFGKINYNVNKMFRKIF